MQELKRLGRTALHYMAVAKMAVIQCITAPARMLIVSVQVRYTLGDNQSQDRGKMLSPAQEQ